MSLETKIRELMEAKKAKAQKLDEALGQEGTVQQGSSQTAPYAVIDPHTGAASNAEDSTVKKGPAESQAKQGDSKDAAYTEMDPHHPAGTGKFAEPTNSGAGNAPNYTTTADPTSVVNQSSSKGNVAKEDVDTDTDATITEEDLNDEGVTAAAAEPRKIEMNLEDLRKDIDSVFSADTNLSEEFKTQASKIFEAAVIARVNHEVESLTAELQEQNAAEFEILKEGLVEKVDSYLNYVIEQWMDENEIAVEQGLRTEVAEDFMLGLKNLFQEHYFEVPEDRIDVLEDMSAKVDDASAKLDETIQTNIALKAELDAIKRDRIIESACKDLTATDAEKMSKLLEGVEFDNEKLFVEKVKVVKENYFPGVTPASPEKTLEEQVQNEGEKVTEQVIPANMKMYTEALGRTAKFNK